MNEELKALDDNQTWEIVKLPPGKKFVSYLGFTKIKYKSDRTVERHKARVVAQILHKHMARITKEPSHLLQR